MDTQLTLASAYITITDLNTLSVSELEALHVDAKFEAEAAWRAQSELTACENIPLDLAQFAITQAEAAETRRREIYAVLQSKYYPQPTILFNEHDPLAENIRTTNGGADEMDLIAVVDFDEDAFIEPSWRDLQ